MRVAVVGGGISGVAIEAALGAHGCSVTRLSRSSGFDVLADDAVDRLASVRPQVIVEATGRFTTSRRRATDFFTRSTAVVGAAAERSGARHVLLSIVNCTRSEVQGYGYFAGKTAQEQAAGAAGRGATIVRSAQWFEFAAQNLERLRVGPIAFVPRMTIAPVSLEAVATVVAEVATGRRSAPVVEVAGPETTSLWAMTTALPHPGVVPVPMPIPGRTGRAFRDGALLPADDVEVVGPTFHEWLATARP